jgi:hypothetical protein
MFARNDAWWLVGRGAVKLTNMSAIFAATSMPDRDWWAALWPQAVVEPAGFNLAQLVKLPPYHYGAIFERQP